MSGKKSAEMKAALRMVKRGATAYAAAQKSGITPGALYKSPDYRAIMAEKKTKEKN